MTTLAFDGRTGASGDMLLGALAAVGADTAVLDPVAAALPVTYDFETVDVNGVAATDATVTRDGGDAAEGGPARTRAEVATLVDDLPLSDAVRADVAAVFDLLADAEGAVHGESPDAVHFHEVGADDAIADVVGVAALLADLDPDRVVTTPVAAGSGEVTFDHGTYPVPAPAVVELAERADWSLYGGPVDAELLTPTGAALLAHFAGGVERLPPLRLDGSGYGAGTRRFPDRPNVLRALRGTAGGRLRTEDVVVLETNLDDAAPESLGDLQSSLFEAGARDVSVVPLTMKKSRPGHLVKVVCRAADADRVARRLAVETGTLGVREAAVDHRFVAARHFRTAVLELDGDAHEVPVKVAADDSGAVYDLSAEHEAAAAVAAETDRPTREVAARAEDAVRGDPSDVILHVVAASDWDPDADAYTHPSLDAQGFVHCSKPEQVVAVADANFADDPGPFRLLVVDPARLDAPVKYEPRPAGHYPHVYGPIPRDAVVDVVPFDRRDGSFVLPARFR